MRRYLKRKLYRILAIITLSFMIANSAIFPISEIYAAESSTSKNSAIELDDFMYGYQISGLSKLIYDELLRGAVVLSLDSIKISLPKNQYKATDTTISTSMKMAFYALQDDFPYYEWLFLSDTGNDCTSFQYGTSGKYLTEIIINPVISPYFKTVEQKQAALNEENQVLNGILQKMPSSLDTRYKRLEYIHDYLVDEISYDSDAVKAHNNRSSVRESVYGYAWYSYGALLKNLCVCEGYAKAFKLACDKLNIPCQLVSGIAGSSHMWNLVQMEDGKWYNVDVTFDDPIYSGTPSNSQYEKDKKVYFLVGSDTLKTSDPVHTLTENYFSYMPVSKADYDASDQTTEPLIIYEGFLQERYLNRESATMLSGDITPPKINYTSKTIYVNKKISLKLSNLTDDSTVTYKSSDEKIAKVNSVGRITGITGGTATITTTVKQNDTVYTFSTKVKIKEPYLKFTKKTSTMDVGDTEPFKVKRYGISAPVSFTVNKPSYVDIENNGSLGIRLTAKKAGTVKITAICNNIRITMKVKINP